MSCPFYADEIKRDSININKVFMKIAIDISSLSKDPSTKTGAVLVSPDRRSISIGYNGFPPEFPDRKLWLYNRGELKDEFTKYDLTNHAERNAIDQCQFNNLSGWSIYCTHKPCLDCARAIITKDIKNVYWNLGQEVIKMDIKSNKVDKLFEIMGVKQEQVILD